MDCMIIFRIKFTTNKPSFEGRSGVREKRDLSHEILGDGEIRSPWAPSSMNIIFWHIYPLKSAIGFEN